MKRIAVIGTGHIPEGGDTPPAEIVAIVSSGFDARLVEPENGVFPGTPAAREHEVQAIAQTGEAVAAAGFDGIFINTVGDYGLWPLRKKLSIPVVGAGEAAFRLAASLGQRFSVVTIWPSSLAFLYEHVLADSNATELCTSIRYLSEPADLEHLGDEVNFVTEMRACFAAPLRTIINACRAAVEEDGADVVVLGCTCMAPTYATVQEELSDLIIVDPMTAGYRYTELLVNLQ